MKRSKGFTLIELLTVIVILAIIALIAVPVILNIVEKARVSAFKDTAYGIVNAGELYFAERMLDTNMISQNELITLPDTRLSLKGDIPNGKVAINTEGKVALAVNNGRYCAKKEYNDLDVTLTEDLENCNLYTNGIMTATNDCITAGTCPNGTKVNVQVSPSQNYNFYVIKDTNSILTLITDRNLGGVVEWYSSDNNSYGPINVLNYLNIQTQTWTNIAPIKSYEYKNNPDATGATKQYGYQKLEIINGVGVLTNQDETTITELEGISRARMITYDDATTLDCTESVGNCPAYLYGGTTYWTLTTRASNAGGAYLVFRDGHLGYTNISSRAGIRPVIELSK